MANSGKFTDIYKFNPELKIWQKREGQNFHYSDGEQVETQINELLAGVGDKSVLSDELRQLQTSWPTFYYLSANRSNLLRPLAKNLLNGARVLELGCGMGAVTRYLGETAAEVFAVEGSARRGMAAATRCSDLNNVQVIIDEIKSLPESLGKFDVVTLIGVLEYSRSFGGPGAEIEVLKKAKSFLKPGGSLILAIENKLGLKYFGGAKEDHLARSFASITNAYRENGVTTWSRKELLSLLARAGFTNCEQFVPLPDYKLPRSVITQQGLDASPSELNLTALLDGSRRPYDLAPLFNMGEAWTSVVKAGLLPDLADSLCFVAKTEPDAKSSFEDGALFHYYSDGSFLPMRYAKALTLRKTGDSIRVEREKALPEQGDRIGPYHQVLQNEPYYPGELLIQRIRRVAMAPDWRLEEFFAAFDPWADALKAKADANWECDGALLDFAPFNLVYDKGELKAFDQEWRAERRLPLVYLLYRGLFHTMSRIGPLAKSSKHAVSTFAELFQKFIEYQNLPADLPVSLDDCFGREEKFLKFIKNKPKMGMFRGVELEYMQSA